MGFGGSLIAQPSIQNVNQQQWGGTTLTGRDITSDIAKLVNLDIALSALRDALRGTGNKTLTDIAGQLDITLSALRDGIRGTGNNTLTDIYSQLDITLSALRDALRGTDNRTLTDLYNRAYDATNAWLKISIESSGIQVPVDIQGSTIKVPTDIQGSTIAYDSTADRFLIKPDNPPNLDTTLSSRASEDTLNDLRNVSKNLIPPVTVPSGYTFVAPAGSTAYVSEYLFADGGDIYCDGDVLII